MGAFSQIAAFDLERHERLIVPALREFLNRGALSEELQPIFDRQLQQSLLAEKQNANFYAKHPKWSEQLQILHSGLALDLESICHKLNHHLGVQHESVAELAAIQPTIRGGCDSDSCMALSRCPFRRIQSTISSELVMSIFQKMVKSSCLEVPSPVILGRHFQFYELGWWYGNEMGLEYEAAEQFFLKANDELTLLLAQLCKRGGIWGWADGGYGEGLLGWLSREECLTLATQLDAYDFSESAPIPSELNDHYLRKESLPNMRLAMAQLRDFARLCGGQQLGLLLERQ